MEERLNSSKPLDELKERESELRGKKAEAQKIINSKGITIIERMAVESKLSQINEEEALLQTQIAEREATMLLRERIKEIFKKYEVSLTAVVLPAGVTIGAVVGSITNALKTTGKAMANGFKDLGAKLSSLLPGLVGQVGHSNNHRRFVCFMLWFFFWGDVNRTVASFGVPG